MYILIVKPYVCLQIYNDFPLHHVICMGTIYVQRVYLIHDKVVGLALKNRSSSDNPVILATERYWMTSCKSRL